MHFCRDACSQIVNSARNVPHYGFAYTLQPMRQGWGLQRGRNPNHIPCTEQGWPDVQTKRQREAYVCLRDWSMLRRWNAGNIASFRLTLARSICFTVERDKRVLPQEGRRGKTAEKNTYPPNSPAGIPKFFPIQEHVCWARGKKPLPHIMGRD